MELLSNREPQAVFAANGLTCAVNFVRLQSLRVHRDAVQSALISSAGSVRESRSPRMRSRPRREAQRVALALDAVRFGRRTPLLPEPDRPAPAARLVRRVAREPGDRRPVQHASSVARRPPGDRLVR